MDALLRAVISTRGEFICRKAKAKAILVSLGMLVLK